MSYNLFIEHHELIQTQKGNVGIGTGWEDDFTNILSFYLSCDAEALDAFCHFVLGKDYESPLSIETQVVTNYGRPDIFINLNSGSKLVVECKVDASLQSDQLQRYLKIEHNPNCRTYVALFSKRSLDVPVSAIENSRYKAPHNHSHFFWTDLFRVLPKAGTENIGMDVARSFFRNYLELIGFAPSTLNQNWARLYEDRTVDENQKVQKEFGRKLAAIRKWLKERKFRVTAVSHSGLQAVPKSGPLKKVGVYFLTIGPQKARKDHLSRKAVQKINNEVFRLALIYNMPEVSEHVWRIYKAFPCPLTDRNGHLWWPTKPYKFSKSRVRLDFVTNLDQFLENETEIEQNITNSCEEAIECIFTIIERNISDNISQNSCVVRPR